MTPLLEVQDLHVTYYNVNKPNGELSVFETFTMHRKRSDAR